MLLDYYYKDDFQITIIFEFQASLVNCFTIQTTKRIKSLLINSDDNLSSAFRASRYPAVCLRLAEAACIQLLCRLWWNLFFVVRRSAGNVTTVAAFIVWSQADSVARWHQLQRDTPGTHCPMTAHSSIHWLSPSPITATIRPDVGRRRRRRTNISQT